MKKITWLMLLWLPMLGWAQVKDAESTLAQLHDRLALTAQQQAVWTAYESSVEAYTSAYYRQRPVLPAPEDAAPRQIGRLVDNLQNRLAALEDVEASARVMYASLSPEQQKVANQLLLATIPTFSSLGAGAAEASTDAHRKDKPDAGKRAHRSGAGTGGMAAPMSGN